jgi:hypothetical protein
MTSIQLTMLSRRAGLKRNEGFVGTHGTPFRLRSGSAELEVARAEAVSKTRHACSSQLSTTENASYSGQRSHFYQWRQSKGRCWRRIIDTILRQSAVLTAIIISGCAESHHYIVCSDSAQPLFNSQPINNLSDLSIVIDGGMYSFTCETMIRNK